MISFLLSIALLLVGYLIYGKISERIFKTDPSRVTPAMQKADGVDFVPMKTWKVFLIQFLNIAGLGPIFGAIMGAQFGPSCFIWITLGCIFAGSVHDYYTAMVSLRNNGESLPEFHGKYLGNGVKQFMRYFIVLLLLLVGVVFVSGPAELLASLTPQVLNTSFWIVVIIFYYLLATLVPIDKIIGKIYPVFGICILFMAVGIFTMMLVKWVPIPELWDGLQNRSLNPKANPIFPMLFISIACGAVSGFHATQSPLMARCLKNEKYGRPVFFGAMIAEGVVALIWAAAASYFFFEDENGMTLFASGSINGALVVNQISRSWLGSFGAILAIFGVIAAPITTGDTAIRSARLLIADFLHYDQKPLKNRLIIAIPFCLIVIFVLIYSRNDPKSFESIWRYFSCANQILAAVTLWAISVYLIRLRKPFVVTLIPALFMSMVTISFIMVTPKIGLGLPGPWAYGLSGAITLGLLILFFIKEKQFLCKR